MHRNSTHLDSHKFVRGWSGPDSAGLHVLVSLLADWLSSACLNIRMELQILRAGPSLTLMIFTMSLWVRRRNALPSICQQKDKQQNKLISSNFRLCLSFVSFAFCTKTKHCFPVYFTRTKCISPQCISWIISIS